MAIFYPPTPSGVGNLVWDSLKKRKREYDMASKYFRKKRKLVTYKGRKRRRTARRRMPMTYKSNHGLGTSGNYYRNKSKSSLKAYRRKLYNSTNEDRHYRATDTITGIIITPTSFVQKRWGSVPMIPTNFTDPGVTDFVAGETRFFDRFCVIRGGLSSLTFKNQDSAPIRVEVYNIWMEHHAENTYVPEFTNDNNITNLANDPTNFSERATIGQSAGREFRILKRRQALIEGDGVWTIMDKIPVQRVSLPDFNTDTFKNDKKMYYWFCVDSPGENTSNRCDWNRVTSMSYSGDIVNSNATA